MHQCDMQFGLASACIPTASQMHTRSVTSQQALKVVLSFLHLAPHCTVIQLPAARAPMTKAHTHGGGTLNNTLNTVSSMPVLSCDITTTELTFSHIQLLHSINRQSLPTITTHNSAHSHIPAHHIGVRGKTSDKAKNNN